MNRFFGIVEGLVSELEATQNESIEAAAGLISESILSGGILQSFGCGHSYGSAIEITARAGGLIPSKCLRDPAYGAYEHIEGVGTHFLKKAEIAPEDVVVVISNSGRNPMPIEIALGAQERGAKVIAVTSVSASSLLSSKHSSGKRLYEIADVVLDNRTPEGDAAVRLEGMSSPICGVSSISAAILLQCTMCRACELMLGRGFEPPVYMSQNLDGGREFNEKLTAKYFSRIYHI